MTLSRAVLVLWLLAAPALAQAPPFAAPDQELWELMVRALDDVPMSLAAHNQVKQILGTVQREAQARAQAHKEEKK